MHLMYMLSTAHVFWSTCFLKRVLSKAHASTTTKRYAVRKRRAPFSSELYKTQKSCLFSWLFEGMLGWAQLFPAWSSTPWPPYSPSSFSSAQPFRETLLAPLLPPLPANSDQQKADTSWSLEAGILVMLNFMNCCGSGMFIPHPGPWFLSIPDSGSRIPDSGSNNSCKREGEKNLLSYLFCSHKYYKFQNRFIKNLGQFTKNWRTFSPKTWQQALKIWVWEPRSGIRKKHIWDPRSRD